MRNVGQEKGLTLLSLVITIIVMIILAGIAIRAGIGDNGILGITQNTVDQYQNAVEQEQKGTDTFANRLNEVIQDDGIISITQTGENETIADVPSLQIIGWTSTGGVVQISIESDYITQYRIGTGGWQDYTGQVNIENGSTISARYKKNNEVSKVRSKIIEDDIKPEVTMQDPVVDGGEITVNVSAQDKEMGMPETITYSYYIKPSGETDYQNVGHNTTGEYTFAGLQAYTSYDIRVITTDKAGNQGAATSTVLVGSVDTEAPTINLLVKETTTRSITVNANAVDEGSGIKEYKFYIGIAPGEYGEAIVQNIDNLGGGTGSTEGGTQTVEPNTDGFGIYTFENLTQYTTYYIKVEVTDNAGNTAEQEISTRTYLVPNEIENKIEWNESETPETATANVTLSTPRNYDIMYTTETSNGEPTNWQAYTIGTVIPETNGGILYACLTDGLNNGEYITINVTDFEGPLVNIETSGVTTNAVTVNVTAEDRGAGMPENPVYSYYIKESGEDEYELKAEIEDTHYTFTGLNNKTVYDIKVETKDKIGNLGDDTISATLENLIFESNVTLKEIVWHNGLATITVQNNSNEYDMQYQIASEGTEMDDNGSWTVLKEKQTEIEGLENKSIVYVKLTDGINTTEGYATFNIDNPSKESYTEQELAKDTTRSSYDILGISVNSDEVETVINEEQENAILYSYYYKNINEDKYTLISTNTYYNEPAVIADVIEGGIYKILVTALFEDGNSYAVTRSENKATTIALAQADVNQTYAENRTYIDNSTQLTLQNSQGETREANAGYTVSLPATFRISASETEQQVSEGVVLEDSSNNEYVWIPVEDAIYDGVTPYPTGTANAESRTYKPMAIRQTGYEDYYEGIIYTFNGSLSYRNSNGNGIGHSSYREPSLLTNNSADGYTWRMSNIIGNKYDADSNFYNTVLGFDSTTEMGEYMAANYNSMITAVDSYGGFYVGRYETTFDTAQTGDNSNGGSSNSTYVVGSKPNSQVLATTNWYNMYLYQDSSLYSSNPYSNMASVSSSMIWGSQWDSMLNYILKGADNGKVTTKVGQQKNVLSNSAQDSSDIINNIYDLGSNAYEWTQEANNINYRIYRGGGYDSTIIKTPSTRSTVVPDDMGPIFGTRLSLYMQSTNDVTGPSVSIQNTNPASNAITVTVRAVDRETGVSTYQFYIGTDSSNLQRAGEGTNEYMYTGLTQNTKYYIRVDAVDGAGNVGQSEVVEVTTTGLGAVANTAITLNQMYGSDGNGIVQVNLAEEYSNTEYEIRYRINGEGNYTSGSLITNLSNGDIITAVVADDNNMSEDEFRLEVTGLEEYAYIDASGNTYTETQAQEEQNKGKTSYDTNITYTDSSGAMATIPSGFKVGVTSTVNTINNGLVVQDEDGNEYVWVPATAIETNTSTTSSEKAMARYQSGYDEDSENPYFEGILYNFGGTNSTKRSSKSVLGTSTYREPTLVTGGADYTWNVANGEAIGTTYDTTENYYRYMGFETSSSVNAFGSYTEFGAYMNQEYSNMIQSVDKYGGFYVGRYETSTIANEDTVTQNSVVQSKLNANPINNGVWYKDYYALDSNINSSNPYYGSKSVTSSMIWGSQWDAMINWMLQDEKTASFVTEITGNHTEVVSNTGMYTNDLAKNIFDLSANVTEWTQTGDNNFRRFSRGSTAGNVNTIYGQRYAASYNDWWSPPTRAMADYTTNVTGVAVTGNYLGTRLALYIKNSTDPTEPEITVDSVKAGTNNVEVRVTANDEESGINNYIYSISLIDFSSPDFNEETSVVQKVTAYADVYTFTGLNQNQTYYIRVEAINGVGLTGTAYSNEIKTSPLDVQEGAIILEKVWGKDGDGKAYFEISDETNFEIEGYYLEHQVDKGGMHGYDEKGEWIQNDTVTGLNVGDVIYTRLSDGLNISSYISSDITELETFSDVYDKTSVYEDYDTVVTEDGSTSQELVGTAYIPAGFKVSTSSLTKKIANGLVIEDEEGNQYVWIPVENAVYDEQTSINESYKPMFRLQQNSNQYYESVYYNFSGITSSANLGFRLGNAYYREPSLVTNSNANYSWIYTAGNNYDATNYNKLADLGINSPNEMGAYLNNQYTQMAQSIAKYGGYYVGRYETSLYTEQGVNSTNGVVAKSIKDVTPMASADWYKMYLVENSGYASNPYYSSSSVESMMITGSQWDTMLNFILTGSDKNKVTAVTGNHTGTREETGLFGNDIMSNIFDLSSNVREWTLEAYSSTYREVRGGFYDATDTNPASHRHNDYPTTVNYVLGSRLALYVK